MKALAAGAFLLPEEAIAFLIAIAGLLLIVGMRRFAGATFLIAMAAALFPVLDPMFDAVLGELPVWVSWVLLVAMGFAIIAALGLGRFFRDVTVHVVGTLLADVIRFLALAPFRVLRFFIRLLFRRVQ